MHHHRHRGSCLIAGAAFALVGTAAWAQQPPEIIVEAPHVHPTTERTSTGGTIDVISVTHRVNYADLDISTAAGAKALEQRVTSAAKAACQEIKKLYPLADPAPGNPPCEKTAVSKAMAQVDAAVAAASKGAKK
jgi:UrcA family protein